VLTAYDAALSPCGGKLRLILECAREDLNDLLTRVKGFRLPEHSARFIAAEVVVALDHIHSRGMRAGLNTPSHLQSRRPSPVLDIGSQQHLTVSRSSHTGKQVSCGGT
jgi:hypothetical protein